MKKYRDYKDLNNDLQMFEKFRKKKVKHHSQFDNEIERRAKKLNKINRDIHERFIY